MNVKFQFLKGINEDKLGSSFTLEQDKLPSLDQIYKIDNFYFVIRRIENTTVYLSKPFTKLTVINKIVKDNI